MPRLETDVRDQRIQFVLQVLQPGAAVAATSRAFGITASPSDKPPASEPVAFLPPVAGSR